MVIDFKTGKELSESRQIRSNNINSFAKELIEWVFLGYDLKVLNTSIKFTSFGKVQSFFAELVWKK